MASWSATGIGNCSTCLPIESYNRMSPVTHDKQLIKVALPAKVPAQSAPSLNLITEALGVPRDILASDEEIQEAWRGLPRRLNQIPPELRSESLARMADVSDGEQIEDLSDIPDADIERMKEIRDAARAKNEQTNLEE